GGEQRCGRQFGESSAVARELKNGVYQLELVEKRTLRRQEHGKPVTAAEHQALAQLGRLREVAAEVTRQRQAAFALEDGAVIAFHDGSEQVPAVLRQQLADSKRDWDRLLLPLYIPSP